MKYIKKTNDKYSQLIQTVDPFFKIIKKIKIIFIEILN